MTRDASDASDAASGGAVDDAPDAGSADVVPDGGAVDDAEPDEGDGDVIVKERTTDEGLLVAVCDADVLGESFEGDGVSLTVTEEFYGGEAVAESDVVASLQRATVANIVGTDAVDLAIEHGFVDEDNVLEVGATRHAQFLSLR